MNNCYLYLAYGEKISNGAVLCGDFETQYNSEIHVLAALLATIQCVYDAVLTRSIVLKRAPLNS